MTASTAARGDDRTEPDRHLGLAGCPNLRDAGGYRTADGGRMRWRRVFRSGHLAHLEDGELESGFILTCQSHPTTDHVVVDFDHI